MASLPNICLMASVANYFIIPLFSNSSVVLRIFGFRSCRRVLELLKAMFTLVFFNRLLIFLTFGVQ
jgi:hypothetical protein